MLPAAQRDDRKTPPQPIRTAGVRQRIGAFNGDVVMNYRKELAPVLIVAVGMVAVVSIGIAEPSKNTRTGDQPEMKLPPGWTEEDMMACAIAGTPGKMHEHLAKGAGVWEARTTMWMTPGAEPMTCAGTSKVRTIMDGRYIKRVMEGEMPGMGPYKGLCFYGYDNVAKQFVSVWLDNHSTGIGRGVGELSEDGKTLTWKYTYNCPLTSKPATIREIETITGPDTKTLVSFATDPKTGKEYKMMHIDLTRKPGSRTER